MGQTLNLVRLYPSLVVPQSRVSAVQGSSVDLPCNTAPIAGDRVKLVLWFKNNSSLPVYT